MKLSTRNKRNPIMVLRGVWAFIKVCRNMDKLDEIIEISQNLATSELLKKFENKVLELGPGPSQSLQLRPRLGSISLEALKGCREGSLGRGFADYIISNKLNPEDLPDIEAPEPHLFIRAHLFETHDVWHVVTGFKTNVAGELGLQAFYLAQFPVPLNFIILAAGVINTGFFCQKETNERFGEIVRGWQMGKKAKPLFGIDWKSQWNRSLNEIRQELNLN